MIGEFRDGHPRLMISLPGIHGRIEVEFIVDTGFYGELAVSARLAGQIDGALSGTRDRRLANGQEFPCPALDVILDWNGEQRSVEVLILDGDPLLGTEMLQSYLLQAEMEEGGNVSAEPL